MLAHPSARPPTTPERAASPSTPERLPPWPRARRELSPDEAEPDGALASDADDAAPDLTPEGPRTASAVPTPIPVPPAASDVPARRFAQRPASMYAPRRVDSHNLFARFQQVSVTPPNSNPCASASHAHASSPFSFPDAAGRRAAPHTVHDAGPGGGGGLTRSHAFAALAPLASSDAPANPGVTSVPSFAAFPPDRRASFAVFSTRQLPSSPSLTTAMGQHHQQSVDTAEAVTPPISATSSSLFDHTHKSAGGLSHDQSHPGATPLARPPVDDDEDQDEDDVEEDEDDLFSPKRSGATKRQSTILFPSRTPDASSSSIASAAPLTPGAGSRRERHSSASSRGAGGHAHKTSATSRGRRSHQQHRPNRSSGSSRHTSHGSHKSSLSHSSSRGMALAELEELVKQSPANLAVAQAKLQSAETLFDFARHAPPPAVACETRDASASSALSSTVSGPSFFQGPRVGTTPPPKSVPEMGLSYTAGASTSAPVKRPSYSRLDSLVTEEQAGAPQHSTPPRAMCKRRPPAPLGQSRFAASTLNTPRPGSGWGGGAEEEIDLNASPSSPSTSALGARSSRGLKLAAMYHRPLGPRIPHGSGPGEKGLVGTPASGPLPVEDTPMDEADEPGARPVRRAGKPPGSALGLELNESPERLFAHAGDESPSRRYPRDRSTSRATHVSGGHLPVHSTSALALLGSSPGADEPMRRAASSSGYLTRSKVAEEEPLQPGPGLGFKGVKPLQMAFHSSGLVSKRNRSRPDMASHSTSFSLSGLGGVTSQSSLAPINITAAADVSADWDVGTVSAPAGTASASFSAAQGGAEHANLTAPSGLERDAGGNTSLTASSLGLREVVANASAHNSSGSLHPPPAAPVMPDTPVKRPPPGGGAFKRLSGRSFLPPPATPAPPLGGRRRAPTAGAHTFHPPLADNVFPNASFTAGYSSSQGGHVGRGGCRALPSARLDADVEMAESPTLALLSVSGAAAAPLALQSSEMSPNSPPADGSDVRHSRLACATSPPLAVDTNSPHTPPIKAAGAAQAQTPCHPPRLGQPQPVESTPVPQTPVPSYRRHRPSGSIPFPSSAKPPPPTAKEERKPLAREASHSSTAANPRSRKLMRHRSRPLSANGLQRKVTSFGPEPSLGLGLTMADAPPSSLGLTSAPPPIRRSPAPPAPLILPSSDRSPSSPLLPGTSSSSGPGGPSSSTAMGLSGPGGLRLPVPQTPTRNPASIKWFQLAQLVDRRGETAMGLGRFQQQFHEESILGSGEFSEVVKAMDRETSQISAVKRSKMPFKGQLDRKRALEEVEVMRHLQENGGHANLVRLLDAWEENGHLFLQTELCPSGTLDFFLSEFGAMAGNLDEPRLWKVLAELGAGVAYIHARGVLHLDLKPANVLITATGSLKIADFGMATLWPRSSRPPSPLPSMPDDASSPAPLLAAPRKRGKPVRQATFEREGDREYIAPEVLSVGQYGPEADVFCVGLIMLEAAGNVVLPDNGEAWHKLRNDDFTDVDLTLVSDGLVEIIIALLESQPLSRPSMAEVLEAPALQVVQERMRQGVYSDELDQLPDLGPVSLGQNPPTGLAGRHKVLPVRGALLQEPVAPFLADLAQCAPPAFAAASLTSRGSAASIASQPLSASGSVPEGSFDLSYPAPYVVEGPDAMDLA